jgi:hypothetical protein
MDITERETLKSVLKDVKEVCEEVYGSLEVEDEDGRLSYRILTQVMIEHVTMVVLNTSANREDRREVEMRLDEIKDEIKNYGRKLKDNWDDFEDIFGEVS